MHVDISRERCFYLYNVLVYRSVHYEISLCLIYIYFQYIFFSESTINNRVNRGDRETINESDGKYVAEDYRQTR